MKKIISTVIATVMLTVISSSVACAESTAPPEDGMNLWIKAAEGVSKVTQKRIEYVTEWEDLSQNGNDLTPIEDCSIANATISVNADWDNEAIGKTYGYKGLDTQFSGKTGSIYIRNNKDTTEVVPEGEKEKGLAVVAADPLDESGANKALMINPDKGTNISLLHYAKKEAGLQVFSEKVMWTAQSGECQWYLYGGSKVNIVPEEETIAVKNNAKTETYCTLNYNEWNEFTYVFDVKLTADNAWDKDNTTCTAYVNNQKLFTETFTNLKVNTQYGLMPYFTCTKGVGNGALLYFDDYINYYDLSDTSKFEIKNYDAMNNSVYMADTEIRLQIDSMIGEDYGVPFDRVEWYCDGELIGEGESIEYTTTVGGHTIYAAGYISANDESIPTMYTSDLEITVESGIPNNALTDEDFNEHTGLKIDSAVRLSARQYLQSPTVDYSGDTTFVLYFKPRSTNAGTIFSSHSYTGETINDSGRMPFSIAVNDEQELVFEMGDFSEELGVSILDDNNNLKNYMSLYLSISDNMLYVYSSDETLQRRFTEAGEIIELPEMPYIESYAYNLDYDNKTRISGMQSYIAESIIYERALDIDEINSVNEYLKLKYEFPILEKMELENEISEIKKGESESFKVLATGNLIENEITEELEGFTVSSSNTDVITVDCDTMEFQAINFGTSKITISYEGLDDIVFTITVPQVFISPAVIGDFSSGGVLECSRIIENYAPDKPVSVVAVSALYQNNELIDIDIEKADDIREEYIFEAMLELPDDVDNCSVVLMLLDGSTMAPITDITVKNN